MGPRGVAIGFHEFRVAPGRILEQIDCLEQTGALVVEIEKPLDEVLAAYVLLVGGDVRGGSFRHRRLLVR